MWDKLLSLFKDQQLREPREFIQRPDRFSQESLSQEPSKLEGPSTQIGFNYLKGMDDEDNNPSRSRRFINLNRLLRGDYDGQIAPTNEQSQANIRGKDS